jgi:hypothetical protein
VETHTLYTIVRSGDLARVCADGFHEGDEVNEPDNPLVGVMSCEDPEAWDAAIETGEWVTVAVTLYPHAVHTPGQPYHWIPAPRLRGALIRHAREIIRP